MMDEKTTTREFLKRIEQSESFVSASLEKDIRIGDKHFGIADVVFDSNQLAIEVKGNRGVYKECIGQAINYECGGYNSAIVVPENGVNAELFDSACRASVGLLTISSNRKLTVHYPPSGGWPFGYDEMKTPEPKDKKNPERDNPNIVIDEDVNWEKELR